MMTLCGTTSENVHDSASKKVSLLASTFKLGVSVRLGTREATPGWRGMAREAPSALAPVASSHFPSHLRPFWEVLRRCEGRKRVKTRKRATGDAHSDSKEL
jgi:hypothetical protein